MRKGFSLSSPLSDKLEEEEPNMGMAEGCEGWCLQHRSPYEPETLRLSSASRSALFSAAWPQPQFQYSLLAGSVIYISCICRRS